MSQITLTLALELTQVEVRKLDTQNTGPPTRTSEDILAEIRRVSGISVEQMSDVELRRETLAVGFRRIRAG